MVKGDILPDIRAAGFTRRLEVHDPRFAEHRVLVFSTLPPDILLPGAKVSQDVKCFAVGHRLMSMPQVMYL